VTWRKATFSRYPDCVETDTWRKASFSGPTECLETNTWTKSSYSHTDWTGQCVEARHDGVVGVRDTKQAHLGDARDMLEFTPAQWTAFVGGLK
jgi:hypothetical protein